VPLNPYRSLPDHRFWRKAIANVPSFAIDTLIDAPFRITPEDKVATAGSCFAQNIAHALQTSGFCYFVPESGPADLPEQERLARNYGVYSARYGNIYTTRQLLQRLWPLRAQARSLDRRERTLCRPIPSSDRAERLRHSQSPARRPCAPPRRSAAHVRRARYFCLHVWLDGKLTVQAGWRGAAARPWCCRRRVRRQFRISKYACVRDRR
jgi:hypothetical protein